MKSNAPSVFFVDDEPHILESLRRLLIDESYEVRIASDPLRALEEIRKRPPTAVVSDYHMPGMTGPQLLREVRVIDPGIVRIILTGKPDIGSVLSAVNGGEVYRYAIKPWDDDELRMMVRTALDYARLLKDRERLQLELEGHRRALQAIEKSHPGISRLPPRDATGAFVLPETKPPARKG
ncbi:MAG: response regulator [Planctomycetota bacterium]